MAAEPTPIPIQALIFDLDGVLVDSEPLTDLALTTLLQQHGCTIDWSDQELTTRLMGRRMTDILEVVAEICGIPTPGAELNATLEALRRELIPGRLRPHAGAADLLTVARTADLRLALATSGHRSYVDAILAEARLTGCFDVEVTGEEVTHGKPHPETYLLAASRLGIDPAACVVLEDAPNGIAAAVAAGMRSVTIPNDYTWDLPCVPPPEVVLPDLAAVIPWLQAQEVAAFRSNPSAGQERLIEAEGEWQMQQVIVTPCPPGRAVS